MSVNAWAFLVSRNQYLDYRTVVAPDFLCREKIANLLARATDGDISEPGQAYFRMVKDSKVGDFFILFRVETATEKDLSPRGAISPPGDPQTVLKDPFGREIFLVRGIVLDAADGQPGISISAKDIERVHQDVAQAYGQFWQQEEAPPAVSSAAVSLPLSEASAQALTLETLPPLVLESVASGQKSPSPSFPLPVAAPVTPSRPEPDRGFVPPEATNARGDRPQRPETMMSVSPAVSRSNGGYASYPTENASRFPLALIAAATGVGAVALLAIALFTRANPFARRMPKLCTTVESKSLILNPSSNLGDELSRLKETASGRQAYTFISGSLQLDSNIRLLRKNGNLSRREPLIGEERSQVVHILGGGKIFPAERSYGYTLLPEQSGIRLEDHPLDLAIAQLGNQKLAQPSHIQAVTIVEQNCERR